MTTGPTSTNFPAQNQTVRRHLAKNDICPECGGELDTGWECNDCEYDAMPLVKNETQP